jgi:hypothetical protein
VSDDTQAVEPVRERCDENRAPRRHGDDTPGTNPDGLHQQKLIRVFPRRTSATPDDGRTGFPFLWDEADEVHISVTFREDIPFAERLLAAWASVAPARIGGPALDDPGGEFTPGLYLKRGYTITSRGCPNHCWFCLVPRREGPVRELAIHDGWNILDSNLLACSESHVRSVFAMLKRQDQPANFTGGLDASLLADWHIDELMHLKTKQLFFAYDTPNDYEPLIRAGRLLTGAGFTRESHKLRCFVLIGYHRDTFDAAEKRLRDTWDAGFFPMAMLYRDGKRPVDSAWIRFQRQWANPYILACNLRRTA